LPEFMDCANEFAVNARNRIMDALIFIIMIFARLTMIRRTSPT
jgi:hypothetical protein